MNVTWIITQENKAVSFKYGYTNYRSNYLCIIDCTIKSWDQLLVYNINLIGNSLYNWAVIYLAWYLEYEIECVGPQKKHSLYTFTHTFAGPEYYYIHKKLASYSGVKPLTHSYTYVMLIQ